MDVLILSFPEIKRKYRACPKMSPCEACPQYTPHPILTLLRFARRKQSLLHSMTSAVTAFLSLSKVRRRGFLHTFQLVNQRWEATDRRKEGINTVETKLLWKTVHFSLMCGFIVLFLLWVCVKLRSKCQKINTHLYVILCSFFINAVP